MGILCLFRHVRWYVGNQWGYIFGRAGFVFHLVLVFLTILGCACVLFAFILQMFSALLRGRIFGPQFPRDPVLYNPLQVLSWMFRWLAEHPVLPSSIFLPKTDEVWGRRTWLDSFSRFSVSLCYLSVSFNDRGEDSISPRVSSS